MIEPPAPDIQTGMLTYTCEGPRYDIILREGVDDFVVEEVVELGELSVVPCKGYVPVYRVEKRGVDTIHMADEMGGELRSRVNFAGLKDRNARVIQYVSATSSRARSPEVVERQHFRAVRIGFSSRPVTRGMMLGNRFSIVVRGGGNGVAAAVESVYARCRERRLPNFFGYQRFGRGMVTHRVGRAIVRRDFEEAVRIILCEPREGEGSRAREARELASNGRYPEARILFSRSQDIELRVINRILEDRTDFLGAIRRIPLRVRRLLVHAYQSYLFNLTLSGAIRSGMEISMAESGDNWSEVDSHQLNSCEVHGAVESPAEGAIPMVQLVGYSFRDYGSRFDGITKEVLRGECVEPKQFYIKEAEEISSEGGFRHALLLAKELGYETREDGSSSLHFTLGRGEYATCILREVIKPENALYSGF